MSPLHADFQYEVAYPVPVITAAEFDQFVSIITASLGSDRADAFASALLWVRVGIPTRLRRMGLDDESSMVYAHTILERLVLEVTGLSTWQIAVAVPQRVGDNARILLLSSECLSHICATFEYIAEIIETLTYPHDSLESRLDVIDQIVDLAGGDLERSISRNPYVSPDVYQAVKSYWT